MKCMYCQESRPECLRALGKDGGMVCLPCVQADPERTAEAKRIFSAMLDKAEEEDEPLLLHPTLGPIPASEIPGMEEAMDALLAEALKQGLSPGNPKILRIPLESLPLKSQKILREAHGVGQEEPEFDLASVSATPASLAPSTRTLQ